MLVLPRTTVTAVSATWWDQVREAEAADYDALKTDLGESVTAAHTEDAKGYEYSATATITLCVRCRRL